ncbi:MAG: hypothetical protein DRP08_00245 [Candidatus Aenigmatarchaeota archaeon]|nr:MAG: hypothetical protein DRP08_00245 [Candidatus Aenigmarchaeota archaeon]
MKLRDAVEKAKEKFKYLKHSGFYLISGLTIAETIDAKSISYWKLHFLNPQKNEIITINVNKEAKIEGTSAAIKKAKEIDVNQLKITAIAAINNIKKKYPKIKTKKIIIIGRFDSELKKHVWTVNILLYPTAVINSFDIDGKNGQILTKRELSIFNSLAS